MYFLFIIFNFQILLVFNNKKKVIYLITYMMFAPNILPLMSKQIEDQFMTYYVV